MNITDFSMNYFSLKGKNAVVTGGNTGLGQAFALALAKAGANICVPGLSEDGDSTKNLIENEKVRYRFMKIDITEPGAPARIIETCSKEFGSTDILVNNAGVCINKDFSEFGREEWDRMMHVNLTAAFELSHEAAKGMIPGRSGKIINICSLFSFLGGRLSPAYASAKHGLVGLTKACCDELGEYNIQVNGIAPGYYATELTTMTRSNPETNNRVLEHIPAGRWGETSDLMGTVVFLASKASDYVNGHILTVDGGYLVR